MKRIDLTVHIPEGGDPGVIIEAHDEEGALLSLEPGADFADAWFRVGEDLEERLQLPDK
jgi:hypothetical protein